MAAFDMADPAAVVSPGGVGFDINCGVRLVRTNLSERDVAPIKEQLAQVRGTRREERGREKKGRWSVCSCVCAVSI